MEVSTSVSFLDVTRPAVEKFAEFPVIEAKFPHDFFYPFISNDWRTEKKIVASSGRVTRF